MRTLARRLAETARSGGRRPWPGDPVRVVLVITELDVGGAEKALVSLATGLDRRRWSPRVVALGPDAALAQPLREAGIPVKCLDVRPSRPIHALRTLIRALKESGPALVQSFLFHANVASRVAVAVGWPPGAIAKPWVLGGHRVAEREKRWHVLLERRTAFLGAGSVCVSEGVRRFAEESGWPAERLAVIPNAVDPTPFDRPENRVSRSDIPGLEEVPADAFLTLYVGRLSVQKGLDTLIEAAAAMAASPSGRRWHLALVGDGPEGERLRHDVAGRPALAGRVHWLGHRRNVPALLNASDLLVLPSRWEGMPNAVLEAMAARRAVIATAVEGSRELVRPGLTGWLVPPGDPAALDAALRDAASDRGRLRLFGEAGRARVEADFSPSRTTADYQALWAGLLGYHDEEPSV